MERAKKTDLLTASLRKALQDREGVKRPQKRANLQDLDVSNSPEKIAEGVCSGDCDRKDIRVSNIRMAQSGLGTVWVRCLGGRGKKDLRGDPTSDRMPRESPSLEVLAILQIPWDRTRAGGVPERSGPRRMLLTTALVELAHSLITSIRLGGSPPFLRFRGYPRILAGRRRNRKEDAISRDRMPPDIF